MDAPASIEFRQLPKPPGFQASTRVVCTAVASRFLGGCQTLDEAGACWCAGTDVMSPPSILRWDYNDYWLDDRDAPMYNKCYIFHGSFCSYDDMVGYDAHFFGQSDDEGASMSPTQRWIGEQG